MGKKDLNVLVIQGGVTKDVELNYGSEGNAYTNFSIAHTKGEKKQYFDVAAFGKLAEICSQYLKKGSQVILTGEIDHQTWETKEGEKRSAVKIIAQDVKFLPSGKKPKSQNGESE